MSPQPASPLPGTVTEVAPGLLRVCLPLPGPPRQVNCWLIADGPGWLLVDAGRGDAATREVWQQVFETFLDGRPITRVLVTHFHPDHVGLAGWLCERWGAPLLMPRSEWQRTRLLLLEDEEAVLASFLALLREAGASAEFLRQMAREGSTYRQAVVRPPARFQPIAGGDVLRVGGRDWQVWIGAGHSPEMACLYAPEAGILISADHILPRISPHIGIQSSEPEADPLGVFLRDLSRFARLPPGLLVLPSHGEPFHGPHARIAALQAHHEAGLDLLAAAAGSGHRAWDLVEVLFRRQFEGRQLSFALLETLAHLRHLQARGRLAYSRGPEGQQLFKLGA